ncbi:MAG TPA: hypothetical protein VFP05_02885 [Thermomicrobiales bacterium]|nr:hypothetical protein [Thermomicrobiales bacterium]
MDETPNDSGVLPASAPVELDEMAPEVVDEGRVAGSRWGETGIRRLSSDELRAQIRRPAVWGLLVLIAVVIAVQVWLLFL